MVNRRARLVASDGRHRLGAVHAPHVLIHENEIEAATLLHDELHSFIPILRSHHLVWRTITQIKSQEVTKRRSNRLSNRRSNRRINMARSMTAC